MMRVSPWRTLRMPVTAVHPAGPVLLVGVLALVLAAIIARWSRFYHLLIDREISGKRFHSIDGLRGYLALGVVFHHVVINYQYYQSGNWALTPSSLNTFLGRGSVAFFFMVTAYLFWGRAIDEKGRIDSFRFYVSRLRRMVPMYLFSVALLVITVFALTHFRLLVSPLDLIRQVMAWALFTITGTPLINTFKQTNLINTVFWSLVFEWKFYILFPLLAIFARTRAQSLLVIIAALSIWFYSDLQLEWFFLSGGAAAALTRTRLARAMVPGWIWSAISVAFIAATIEWQPMVYSWIGAALLFVPFVILANGNTLFGLLTWRPARLLGLLSYSIYLLHNWVLFLVSHLVNHYTDVGRLSVHMYWGIGAAVVLITTLLASLTYRFVEYPFLRSTPRRDTGVSRPEGALAR